MKSDSDHTPSHDLIFCSVIFPGQEAETNALLLAESLRAFGGKLARKPLWFFFPDFGLPLARKTIQHLASLDVCLIPFPTERQRLKFFFMGELDALAKAEEICASQAGLLAWLDANTLLLQEPKEFILPADKTLAYRPVHHILLGSRFDQPPDPFWSQIYQACQVAPERIFAMRPVVEDISMRPYFNAGLLVVRPTRGLLQTWRETFLALYQQPAFQAFYAQDQRYMIFMHQAVLAGVILHSLNRDELLELPETYNYPLHLFDIDQTFRRPFGLEVLVTFRHEGFYSDPAWGNKIPARDGLKQWLAEKLK